MMKKINFLLLFILSVFLWSCRTEIEAEPENIVGHQEASFSLLRKEQILQHKSLMSKLSEIESKRLTSNSFGRSVQDSILAGVIINTEKVLLSQRGEQKTYTFPVYREGFHKIENLVLRENKDGTFSGFFIQYDLSEEEKKLFISGYDVNIKSRIKIFNISNLNLTARTQTDVVGCYEITWETGTCSSDYHHEYGDTACVLTGDDAAPKPTIIAIKDVCSQYSNQNDSPDPNPNIPNDGSSGSGYDTAPYTQDEAELIEIIKVFRLKLNAAQLSWYNAHTILGIDLAKLYHEDNSVAHLNFLKSVVEYMRVSDNVKDTFLYAEIIKFLKQDSSYQENWTLIQNIFNEHNPDLGIAVLNFINENPDALNRAEIINRIKALDNALAQNPNLLLDIPCGELSKWQELATHPVPVSIKNRLFQINGLTHWYQDDFAIQNLDFASGPGVNMDLFPIRITSMPFKPGTNQKYTHAEFFDFFRRNINQFAESFTPIVDSSYGIDDTSLWFSNNPLGALIHIEIPGDNGTVVCSGYNTQAWIFTTIKAPITLDGLHPVSGNRLFGYYEDSNGFMYIYTRGVDRFTKPLGSVAINNLAENYAFSKADELWKGMQSKLENYINSIQNGGLANKLEPKTYRPAYAKVKEYLKGQTPLSSLGCH